MRWLHLLARLGLGACLADDMGLGKTIQVLSLLLVLSRRQARAASRPACWWLPASLLANWAAEIERFAPSLKAHVAASLGDAGRRAQAAGPSTLAGVDLVITSYGSLLRLPWLTETHWRLVVLDEAQAIKNPDAKQTTRRQEAEGEAALCADRHAGRKPPGRSVVDLRLHQSRPARIAQGVQRLHQAPGRADAQSLWAAARAGAAVHPAPDEDRQEPSSPTCRTRPR